ncbi:MAG: hypothetical protein IJX17_07945 [Clostridia bacterium]|nr:hypothetical protein [Clostridia bacterium]
MEITSQEKINLSYIFICAYENIVNLIKPIHNSLSMLVKKNSSKNNIDSINSNDLIISMYKIFKEKYKNKLTLKIKDTHRLLVDVNVFSKEDLALLISLSKIRNDIGHESLKIYFNDKTTYSYFKLEELLMFYKKLFLKFSSIFNDEFNDKISEIKSSNNLDYLSLNSLIKNLLNNKKFNNLNSILN